jgi:hypothetical protein
MSSSSSTPCGHSKKHPSSAPLNFGALAPDTFEKLGVPELRDCAKKGEELLAHLAKADEADGRADRDELGRGIRRSLRVDFARAAGLRPPGVPWKSWVAENFGDYAKIRRYARISRLQVELAKRQLPLIKTTNQGRTLLPYADHPDLFTTLREMAATDRLPEAKLLEAALIERLGAVRQPRPEDRLSRVLHLAAELAEELRKGRKDPLLAEVWETAESLLATLSTAAGARKVDRPPRRPRRRNASPVATQPELFALPAQNPGCHAST